MIALMAIVAGVAALLLGSALADHSTDNPILGCAGAFVAAWGLLAFAWGLFLTAVTVLHWQGCP